MGFVGNTMHVVCSALSVEGFSNFCHEKNLDNHVQKKGARLWRASLPSTTNKRGNTTSIYYLTRLCMVIL